MQTKFPDPFMTNNITGLGKYVGISKKLYLNGIREASLERLCKA